MFTDGQEQDPARNCAAMSYGKRSDAHPDQLPQDSSRPLYMKGAWIIILLLGTFTILASGVAIRPLDAFDDCSYADAAKNILKTGDWLNLYWLGGVSFLEKPPLQFWITAGLFRIFGISEHSARLFPIFCGMSTVLVIMLFARRFLSWQASCIAGLALLSFPAFYEYSTKAMLDIPLSFLISLSLLFFHKALEGRRSYFWLYGLALGLAVLTKSVVGFVPLIAGLIFLLLKRPGKEIWRYFLEAILVSLIIIVPWHLYSWIHHGNLFLREYFLYHVVQRMMGAIGYQEGHSIWSYFVEIGRSNPLGLLVLPAIVAIAIRAIVYKSSHELLLLAWTAAIFIPISASAVRLPWYTVPLYPPFALSIAAASDLLQKKCKNAIPIALILFGTATSALWTGYHFQHQKSVLLSQDTNLFQLRSLLTQFRQSSTEKDVVHIYELGEAIPLTCFYADRPIQFQFGDRTALTIQQKIPSNYLEKGIVRFVPDIGALENLMESEGGYYLLQKKTFLALQNSRKIFSEQHETRDFILIRCGRSL
jgi:4-amino-4-deoxy-L-arabinose transferase-like glycosyltransferase